MKLGFGKYADREWEDVPIDYLEYVVGAFAQGAYAKIEAQKEIERRSKGSVTTKLPRDIVLGKILEALDKMPDDLFNREITLEKKYKVRFEKL